MGVVEILSVSVFILVCVLIYKECVVYRRDETLRSVRAANKYEAQEEKTAYAVLRNFSNRQTSEIEELEDKLDSVYQELASYKQWKMTAPKEES